MQIEISGEQAFADHDLDRIAALDLELPLLKRNKPPLRLEPVVPLKVALAELAAGEDGEAFAMLLEGFRF